MTIDDVQAVPPPLPMAAHAERTAGAPSAGPALPELHPEGPARAMQARSRTHWPTVLFGALPASYLSFPAGIGILAGFFLMYQGWVGAAAFFAGLFGWAGMISLWIVARNRTMIGKPTAVGLALGLVGAVLYAGQFWWNDDLSNGLIWFPPILLVGPVWLALIHLNRFRKSFGPAAALKSSGLPRPPPSEASTRRVGRVLGILSFGQVLTFWLIGATLLKSGTHWGNILTTILVFPFALGVASFCVWAFVRHRPCRLRAAGVFFAPVLLFMLLQLGLSFFGESAVTAFCRLAVPLVPLAAVLLFPRSVGRFIPRMLRQRRACITYVVIQGLMVFLCIFLLLGLRPWRAMANDAILLFVVCHTGLSILSGGIGLLFSYLGLFRPRAERHLGWSIAHMALSLLLLALALLTAWLLMISMIPLG